MIQSRKALYEANAFRPAFRQLVLPIIACLVLGCPWTVPVQAQIDDSLQYFDYSDPKTYEIGGVEVNGAEYSDDDAIISVSGLAVGSTITIPGSDIPGAIRSIWKLKLFTDVEVRIKKIIGEVIILRIDVSERPRYTRHAYKGIKKSKHDDLNPIVKRYLVKGGIVTENAKQNIVQGIEDHYEDKGYLDAEVRIEEKEDPRLDNAVELLIHVDPNDRLKIDDITFEGNQRVKERKLRKQMEDTKKRWVLFKKSKFVREDYEKDKDRIIDYYNTLGYRDAEILNDSLWREEDGDLRIHIALEEGDRYYVREISWKGNTLYNDRTLSRVLGVKKGDVYDRDEINKRLTFSQDGQDVSTLYMDDGYLFFQVDPVEVAIENDSIDLEMRIFEGPQATINRVEIKGNDRTHEHVIRRELRTLPGATFSRSDIIRSQREIINLGYFNPEKLGINTPVNPDRGTVDIEYTVEERPSDQLELSAGYGGYSGLIGTLGVTFNNFSLRNLFKSEAWKPLPSGDGQRLSLRGQTNGRFYQSYNASFTEPWLGGKKPTSFTVGGFFTRYTTYADRDSDAFGWFSIGRGFVGLGTRLSWPDDNFVINSKINIENIQMDNYGGLFRFDDEPVENGSYNNYSLETTLTRTSINEPIFPRRGSKFSLTVQLTPPYSLFDGDENYENQSVQERFKWLEYHKWTFKSEWYTSLVGKLVLRAAAKGGFLGTYNEEIGLSPFERFEVGGDGLNNQSAGITGKDIIRLRGYDVDELPANDRGGASVYNKFELELRYPLSLNPNSTIYVLGFAEGGNSWLRFDEYNPFDLKRSAGLGLRVYLPMFGLLGFDYGFGFDKPQLIESDASWTKFGKFSLILGFEPE